MAGYQAERGQAERCVSCPVGRYKAEPGEGECDICPASSKALFAGSVECRCNKGYYRGLADSKAAGCTRPPGPPRNLTVTRLDTGQVEC